MCGVSFVFFMFEFTCQWCFASWISIFWFCINLVWYVLITNDISTRWWVDNLCGYLFWTLKMFPAFHLSWGINKIQLFEQISNSLQFAVFRFQTVWIIFCSGSDVHMYFLWVGIFLQTFRPIYHLCTLLPHHKLVYADIQNCLFSVIWFKYS